MIYIKKKPARGANQEWFRNAKWGLFMHYGLYSQFERGEWVMFHEKIPIAEYEKLSDSFDSKNFDADFITDLALEAEMKYISITACHHEGFCLWKSDTEVYLDGARKGFEGPKFETLNSKFETNSKKK